MYKRIIVVAVLFCYCLSGIAQIRTIDSIIKEEMEQQHIPGLALGIVKDGKIIVSKGYGFAYLKDGIPVTENTVFKIGSLSKQFIATCILALAEQGKLSLSDHIHKYLKDAPEEWQNITIRNLLNHTSGIERESPAFDWMKRQPDSVVIRAVYKDDLRFPTGTKWEYSNMGYFILADIIRQVTGQSFEDYMNNFFPANGLTHMTTTTKSKGIVKAKGYNYNKESGKTSEAIDFIALRPSGAFSAPVTDMIKWDSIQQGSTILTRQDWAKMYEDTVIERVAANGKASYYGYGWEVTPYKGHRLVHHNGSTRGFTTEYWKFIDDKLSIIILTNANEVGLGKVARHVYDTLGTDLK